MHNIHIRFIISTGSELLLEKDFDNIYNFPGGTINQGESVDQAIDRLILSKINNQIDYYIYDARTDDSFNGDVIILYYYAHVSDEMKSSIGLNSTYTWQKIEKLDKINTSKAVNIVAEDLKAQNEAKKTTKITEVKLFTDGGSRGNPGPSALGYVIFDLEDNVVNKGSKYLGITTNNQAEYQAVNEGLSQCLSIGAERVDVYLDSQLVANQMNGIYKIKNRDLWPIHQSIKILSTKFKKGVSFTYIPRNLNQDADAMVNFELDNYEKSINNKV